MNKISRRNFIKLGLAGLLGTSYYEFSSLDRIQYEFHDLFLPLWDADGLKIAFLTDFHIKGPIDVARALKSIEMTLSQKPDLILFGGDFVDAKQPPELLYIRQVLDAISDISIPFYGVLGNHDYAFLKHEALCKEIKKSNLKMLKNEITEIYNIQIIGIDDPYTEHDDYTFLKNKKLSRSRLCLMHTPDCVLRMPPISLQLSGHSHGGQICLPFGVPLVIPIGAQLFTKGYYPKALSPLYVSRGIGTTQVSLRLFCPPEVSILTLRSI